MPIDRCEWVKKMWYLHTMEYYSTTKRNEIIPFASAWMDLEIIILSEVSLNFFRHSESPDATEEAQKRK